MRVLLVCGAGASSGFMAQSMRKAAAKRGLDIEIFARSDAEMLDNVKGADALLVGPHLAYNLDQLRRQVAPFGTSVMMIDREDYGAIDGDSVLSQTLELIASKSGGGVALETASVDSRSSADSDKAGTGGSPVGGLLGWMNRSLVPRLDVVVNNDYVRSIQDSIMTVLPMIMVGSLASIIGVMAQFDWFKWLPDVSLLNTFSFGLVGIFLAFLLPMKVMDRKGHQSLKYSAALTSVAAYLVLVIPKLDLETSTISLDINKIGTGGMLASMLVGGLIAFIFSFVSRHSFFKKDTVMPDIVVSWVDALIPVTVCLGLALLVYQSGFDLTLFVQSLFAPIAAIGQTLPGIILTSFLTCFFYSFGFGWIMFPIVWTIWMDGIAANEAAAAAGQAATNLNLMETFHGLQYIGGQGSTLVLVILMMFSQSRRLKAIGRVAIFPSVFNINEPVVFGAPVVWNPLLMIPMWIISIVMPTLMWIALTIGFAPVPVHPFQLWYLPIYVQAFFATGSFMGVILCLILTAVTFFIWLPFFRVYERQEVRKEAAEHQSQIEPQTA